MANKTVITGSTVSAHFSQTLTVLADLILVARIAAGKYRWTSRSITKKNFPQDLTSVGEWEWKIYYFGRNISSEDVVASMLAEGWDPAKLEHLLSFGEKYPDEQRKYPVIGLGSSCIIDGSRLVPRLGCSATKRNLTLNHWNGDWPGVFRFLAVRKKV